MKNCAALYGILFYIELFIINVNWTADVQEMWIRLITKVGSGKPLPLHNDWKWVHIFQSCCVLNKKKVWYVIGSKASLRESFSSCGFSTLLAWLNRLLTQRTLLLLWLRNIEWNYAELCYTPLAVKGRSLQLRCLIDTSKNARAKWLTGPIFLLSFDESTLVMIVQDKYQSGTKN